MRPRRAAPCRVYRPATRNGACWPRSCTKNTLYADALNAWRYPDLTDHVEYIADIVRVTIEQEMRKEAGYLRSLRLARERVKQVIEGPDTDIDRIIRSVRDDGGKVSNKLAKEFPALADETTAAELVDAVQGVFQAAPAEGAP